MEKNQPIIKADTKKNWEKAKNFIPKFGEIIIYKDMNPVQIKVGNGIDKINDLQFAIYNQPRVAESVLKL